MPAVVPHNLRKSSSESGWTEDQFHAIRAYMTYSSDSCNITRTERTTLRAQGAELAASRAAKGILSHSIMDIAQQDSQPCFTCTGGRLAYEQPCMRRDSNSAFSRALFKLHSAPLCTATAPPQALKQISVLYTGAQRLRVTAVPLSSSLLFLVWLLGNR